MFICPVVSGKHCSLGIIDPLLMLQSFFPLFLYGDPEPLKEGCDILICSGINECRQIVKNIYSFNGDLDLQNHRFHVDQESRRGGWVHAPGRFIGKH